MRPLRMGRGVSGSYLPRSPEPRTQCFVGRTDKADYPYPGVTPGHPGIHTTIRISYRNGGEFSTTGIGA